MSAGNRIRTIRQWKRMTQGELCKGISSVAYLSKVENELTVPSQAYLEKIAERLHVDLRDLTEGAPSRFPDRLRAIHDRYWTRDVISEEDVALLSIQVKELHDKSVYPMLFSTLIRYHYLHAGLKEAQHLYRMSRKLVPETGSGADGAIIYYYYLACAVLHYELHEPYVTNDYYRKAEAYAACVSDREKARLYYNMSVVNQRINPDKSICLYYSGKAYELLKHSEERNRVVNILLVRSIQFLSADRPQEAHDALEEAERLRDAAESDAGLLGAMAYNFGRVYFMTKRYPEAIRSFEAAIVHVHEAGQSDKSLQALKRLVELNMELKDWTAVEKHLREALRIEARYKEVFYDIELHLLELELYKRKMEHSLYEKEAAKLLAHCADHKHNGFAARLCKDLGAHYFRKRAFKKSAECFQRAYELETAVQPALFD
ncbi:helix-turn-helix domain-containing protein [Paenibacillus flagellatus]|uniref:HTH cro/C1-type domain-containing protein n=1 Tax=Paenibacillus flagellatus TaxID=2211139 RepID=A0A2V5KA16_9BACL|nr:helix-turn-helix transcriptional regulator [Paenibacillus flagellatus]PYI56381.1 hypothetical protein DLM86_05215 [Paenibacillus flagellatus]